MSQTLIAMTISVAAKGQEIGSTNLPSFRESLLGVLKVSLKAEEEKPAKRKSKPSLLGT